MSKIQLEPGPASSATHRLTQPSTTLNRRYVTRPTNLAIEEAAHSIPEQSSSTSSSTPSRLVNLRVHSADLLAAAEQEAKTPKIEEPVIHTVVELGGSPEPTEPEIAPIDIPETANYQPEPEAVPEQPAFSTETNAVAPIEEQAYVAIDQIITEPTDPVAVVETVTETTVSYTEPTSAAQYEQHYTPAVASAPTQVAAVDPRDLAMSIAADYAAASMSAAVAEPTTSGVDAYVGLDATSTDSIDAIAQAASDAIASIRTATEPEEISEQIASLKAFAENIRANSSMPEMNELSDTIDKFISVAMKSTKAKETTNKKVSLSSKANRAADKVTKSSAKVINRAKPTVKPAPKTSVASKRVTTANRSAAPRPVSKTAARPTARSISRPTNRPSSAASLSQDQALRRALRSVAAMDDEPEARPARSAVRRKGNVKRFALAFVCAVVCVIAVTYVVGTNIPDISVRVAAMQTGVEASYPSYIPRDYSLKGISSESGKITINFEGPEHSSFTLTEEKSSWDSTTLLRNYVEPTWKDNYTSTHEQGITIYISGSNAAWVNGGVLYKINSTSASLTNKQLRNIVTSM